MQTDQNEARLETFGADETLTPGSLSPLRTVTGFLAAFWATFIDVSIPSLMTMMAWDGFMGRTASVVLGGVAAMAVPLNAIHIWKTWRLFAQGASPLALEVAFQQPRWPLLARPIVSAWWLGCFSVGCMFAFIGHTIPADSPAGLAVVMALLVFGYLYVANGHLLLAVTTWTRRRAIVERVWAMRTLVDLAITVSAWGLAKGILG